MVACALIADDDDDDDAADDDDDGLPYVYLIACILIGCFNFL